MVADNQRAVVADTYIAIEFGAALGLIQAGLVGFDLHAALTQDNISGQRTDLIIGVIARGFCADKGRSIAFVRLVIHARTNRFDIGTRAVRPGLGQLGGGELLARNPVEVTEVFATGFQTAALGFGDQRRFWRCVGSRTVLGRRFAGSTDGTAVMHRTRRQRSSG
ncbi:hypothetical protein D3C87_937150 [compost metagenome]